MPKKFVNKEVRSFWSFVSEQGIVGFAVGFILGTSVSTVVNSLVSDIVNPVLGIFLGRFDDLESVYVEVGGSRIMYGSFLSSLLDFIVIALVIYIIVKKIKVPGCEDIDKKKKVKVTDEE
ncbi:MAG: MscL family protein [Patescibacteria group bacterium]|nr:MscL family protein [Patescibacteria group bacterium]